MKNSDYAVSPVVGVMLMLVVTIIIAAVVSAFAGGLSEGNDKAPQVQIEGTYSLTKGMTITQVGGDPISTQKSTVWVRPSKNIVSEYQSFPVNLSTIRNSAGTKWLKDTGSTAGSIGFKSMVAGDTVYIDPPYHEGPWLTPTLYKSSWFNSTENVGRTFWIELSDANGNIYSKTEVTITA